MPAAKLSETLNLVPIQSGHRALTASQLGEYLDPLFAFTPIGPDLNNWRLNAREHYTSRCVFNLIEMGPYVSHRTRRHASQLEHLVILNRYVYGDKQGTVRDLVMDNAPGPIYVFDQQYESQAVSTASLVQGIAIPKAELGFAPDAVPIATVIERTSPIGLLVHTVMDKLFEQLDVSPPMISEDLIDRFFGCLRIAMGVPAERGDVRHHARNALYALICQTIERNLGSPGFSVDKIVEQFGISRAALYRMFTDKGGVRQYIMDRRTSRAVANLASQSSPADSIDSAAVAWGFSSRSNFNRAVKKRYGEAPGRLIPRQNIVQPGRSVPPRFRTFMRDALPERGSS